MRVHSVGLIGVAAVSLAVSAAPARAQNFMSGSAETIRDATSASRPRPSRCSGATPRPTARAALSGSATASPTRSTWRRRRAFFDGVSMIGGDGQFRVLGDDDDVLSRCRIGGHQAVMSNGPDSTALDLGAEFSAWVDRRVEVYAGTRASPSSR